MPEQNEFSQDTFAPEPPALPAEAPQPQSTPSLSPFSGGSSLNAARFSKSPPVISGPSTAPAADPMPESVNDSQPAQAAAPIPGPEHDEDELGIPIRKREPAWKVGLKALGVFVGTFLVIFGILQGPALWSRFSFFFSHVGATEEPVQLAFLPSLQDKPVSLVDIKNRPQDYLQPNTQLGGYSLADLGDNQLLIPKISVNVPVIWNNPSDEASMLTALQQGVAHYGFTARPNEGKGNVFLSGHSSYTLWDPGKYKTVFANLDRLEAGDQMAITYQGVVYIYQVESKKVVSPSETSVLDQTNEPILSLMTCVPVGTSLNRLVVRSKLISAAPNKPIPLAPPALTDPASIFHYLAF